jgi:hypothetical protein
VPFAEKCFEHAATTALLLRLAVVASQKRATFWQAHPADIYVLSKRPSFAVFLKCPKRLACQWTAVLYPDDPRPTVCPKCGEKLKVTTSDSADYAWFVWGPGRGGQRLEVG